MQTDDEQAFVPGLNAGFAERLIPNTPRDRDLLRMPTLTIPLDVQAPLDRWAVEAAARARHLHGERARPSASPPSVALRYGVREWTQFLDASDLVDLPRQAIALFDKHNVVDRMISRDATDVGTHLDFIEGARSLLCSFGNRYRQDAFVESLPYHPMIMEMDGHIFTDHRAGWHNTIDVYREGWMRPNCIGVRGDKSQVAELLGRPIILFDDDTNNLDLLQARSTATKPMRGVLVPVQHPGRARSDNARQSHYYAIEPNCRMWPNLVKKFVADVRLLGWC